MDVFAYGTMLWEAAAVEIPHANLEPADIAHRGQTKEAAGLPLEHSWPKTLKNLLKMALSASRLSLLRGEVAEAQPEKRPKMMLVVREMEQIIRDAWRTPRWMT